MKNTILLSLFIGAFSFGTNAQSISFETSEGYILGNLNGQNNWETTSDDQGGHVENQVITDEAASHRNYSLKLTKEPEFSGQPQPIVGGFYNYAAPISNEAATFSADIYINSQQDINALSFNMELVHFDSGDGRFRTYLNFNYAGFIDVLVAGGPTGIMVDNTGQTWSPETWYNIQIHTIGETVKFLLDNEEIYVGTLVTAGPIDQVRFVHDNYDGFVYIDNFKTNEDPLSVEDFEVGEIAYFYSNNTKSLSVVSKDLPFNSIEVFNVLGQSILNNDLSQKEESIDISSLKDGIYIVKVIVGQRTKTFKILKN